MIKTLNKYRLSLPLKNGCYVGARSYDAAIEIFFPDQKVIRLREGSGWVCYRVSKKLEPTWPEPNVDNIPGCGGDEVVVELHGKMQVNLREIGWQ